MSHSYCDSHWYPFNIRRALNSSICQSVHRRPLMDIDLPRHGYNDRSCAACIQQIPTTFNRSVVHFVGGLFTPHPSERGHYSRAFGTSGDLLHEECALPLPIQLSIDLTIFYLKFHNRPFFGWRHRGFFSVTTIGG